MQLFIRVLLIGMFSSTTFTVSLYGQVNSDEAKIKKIIIDSFQALADVDISKYRSYCQPDFVLLESGEVWSLDTLEAKIKPYIGSGMKRLNTINFRKVMVKGSIAWVAYDNQADIDIKGQKMTIKWLESAVLDRINGDWKLAMLHSTTLPKKN